MARIVIFTYDRKIDRRILLEIDTLKKLGHDVLTYALACAPRDETPGLNVVRVNVASVGGAPGMVFRLRRFLEQRVPGLFPRLRRWLRPIAWLLLGLDPAEAYLALFGQALAEVPAADIYIAHDLPMLPVACAAADKHGGKIVYDSHEFFVEREAHGFEKRMWRRLEARLIGRAALVIVTNPSLAAALKERYGVVHVAIIQNAEWLPEPLSAPQKLFHRAFGLAESARILLFQGGLSAGRNLDMLIDAMALAATPQLHLVLLGEGEAKAGLKRRAQASAAAARIHFHPLVPQEELISYTMAADAGVIPYQPTCLNNYFCTPNKLYEFIIAGLPMVATDLPELRRLIVGNGLGLVGDTARAPAFAALIDRMFEPETFRRASEAVRQTRTQLNWQNEQKYYAEVMTNVAA